MNRLFASDLIFLDKQLLQRVSPVFYVLGPLSLNPLAIANGLVKEFDLGSIIFLLHMIYPTLSQKLRGPKRIPAW
jgi:hypothetical protein